MILYPIHTSLVLIIFLFLSFPALCMENEQSIKIIERVDFQKKMSVKSLTDVTDGKLKNYFTFSVRISGKLIFCHLSKDRSEPRVLCH